MYITINLISDSISYRFDLNKRQEQRKLLRALKEKGKNEYKIKFLQNVYTFITPSNHINLLNIDMY